MFTISNTVVTNLQGLFEAFAKDGIVKVPNEDVRAATEQIIAIAERLAEVSALPSESTRHILRVHSVLCYRFQADFWTSAGSLVLATALLFDKSK